MVLWFPDHPQRLFTSQPATCAAAAPGTWRMGSSKGGVEHSTTSKERKRERTRQCLVGLRVFEATQGA